MDVSLLLLVVTSRPSSSSSSSLWLPFCVFVSCHPFIKMNYTHTHLLDVIRITVFSDGMFCWFVRCGNLNIEIKSDTTRWCRVPFCLWWGDKKLSDWLSHRATHSTIDCMQSMWLGFWRKRQYDWNVYLIWIKRPPPYRNKSQYAEIYTESSMIYWWYFIR